MFKINRRKEQEDFHIPNQAELDARENDDVYKAHKLIDEVAEIMDLNQPDTIPEEAVIEIKHGRRLRNDYPEFLDMVKRSRPTDIDGRVIDKHIKHTEKRDAEIRKLIQNPNDISLIGELLRSANFGNLDIMINPKTLEVTLTWAII